MINAEEAKHLTNLALMKRDPWVMLSNEVREAAENGLNRIEFHEKNGSWFIEPIASVLEKLEEFGYAARDCGYHTIVVEW